MQKLVNKIINESVKDADIYYSNGATWIIFTDNKQWVIELTENKTLWYNYNFFKNLFNYLSLDVVENQHYITKWVEDNIIGEVNDTHWGSTLNQLFVDNTIQNGVKETITSENRSRLTAENIIQNGKLVSETFVGGIEQIGNVNTVLNFGIKETHRCSQISDRLLEDTIQNEVKHTLNTEIMPTSMVEDTIKNGVKYILTTPLSKESLIDEIIQTGVKETKTPGNGDLMSYVEWMKEKKTTSYPKMIDDVIENGIKETQPLPSQEGNKDWGIYYHKKGNRTKPHTEYVDEAIKTGVKYE